MPQVFQVLRCYKCMAFQVHQTKKSYKFSCKICNEKQSIKRHYGIGIAKDCRMQVQKLNRMRGERDNIIVEGDSEDSEELNTSVNEEDVSINTDSCKRKSKWLSYIDNEVEETDTVDTNLVPEVKEMGGCNSTWQNKNKYQNYKRQRKTNVSKSVQNDNDLDYSDSEEFHHKKKQFSNYSNVLHRKESFFVERSNCTVTSNDSIKPVKSPSKENKFEIAKVPKSSKWADFVEEEEDIVEDNIVNEDNKNWTINRQPLFSLCDENDIDDLLNI